MIGETGFEGVFIPNLLILAVAAFLVNLSLRVILQRVHFYRFVWHAGLFDTALYLVVLWVLAFLTRPKGLGL
jgi:protein AaeX